MRGKDKMEKRRIEKSFREFMATSETNISKNSRIFSMTPNQNLKNILPKSPSAPPAGQKATS